MFKNEEEVLNLQSTYTEPLQQHVSENSIYKIIFITLFIMYLFPEIQDREHFSKCNNARLKTKLL